MGTQESDEIFVQTQMLSEYVTGPVDFLKMDIEGAEQKVLFASQEVLPLVKEFHIEFHTHSSESLVKLVELLEKTHTVELTKDGRDVVIKRATGLIQVRAVNRN